MTDEEIELCCRVSRHPLWVWKEGMLGKQEGGETLRFTGEEDMSTYFPSVSDALTTYRVWKSFKDLNLKDYAYILSKDGRIYKGGFKRTGGKEVLIYNSYCEGVVAIRLWLWFANVCLNLNK